MSGNPLILQTVTVLASGALMALAGLKKRRLELRRPRRKRRRRTL